MIGKLTKLDGGWALLLDRDLMATLELNGESQVEVTANGRSLVITPLPDADRRSAFENAITQVNEQFGPALKRLAE